MWDWFVWSKYLRIWRRTCSSQKNQNSKICFLQKTKFFFFSFSILFRGREKISKPGVKVFKSEKCVIHKKNYLFSNIISPKISKKHLKAKIHEKKHISRLSDYEMVKFLGLICRHLFNKPFYFYILFSNSLRVETTFLLRIGVSEKIVFNHSPSPLNFLQNQKKIFGRFPVRTFFFYRKFWPALQSPLP